MSGYIEIMQNCKFKIRNMRTYVLSKDKKDKKIHFSIFFFYLFMLI